MAAWRKCFAAKAHRLTRPWAWTMCRMIRLDCGSVVILFNLAQDSSPACEICLGSATHCVHSLKPRHRCGGEIIASTNNAHAARQVTAVDRSQIMLRPRHRHQTGSVLRNLSLPVSLKESSNSKHGQGGLEASFDGCAIQQLSNAKVEELWYPV
jgi:hypothetical protein